MSTGPTGEVESPPTSKRVPPADSRDHGRRSAAGLGWPGDRPLTSAPARRRAWDGPGRGTAT